MISFKKLGNYGRFGNQLFQYAYLRAQAKRLHTTFYCPPWAGDTIFHLNDELERVSECEVPFSFNDTFHGFSQEATEIQDNTDITGFFQSPKYFNKNEVLSWFSFRDPFFSDVLEKYTHIQLQNAIGIHLRLGDYTTPQFEVYIPNQAYFEKALHLINKNSKVLIFSDDPQGAKQYLSALTKSREVIFIEGNSELEDFYLLSHCSDVICSPSSYSWWAAYLNSSPSKKVVVPEYWFLPKGKTVNKDIFPEEWIKVRAHTPFFGTYYGQYIPIKARIFYRRLKRSLIILKEKGIVELIQRIRNRKLIV